MTYNVFDETLSLYTSLPSDRPAGLHFVCGYVY